MSRETDTTATVLGIEIDNTTLESAVYELVRRASERVATNVAFVNAHCLNVAEADADYRLAVASADLVFADGIGVRLAGWLTGQPIHDNVNGTDLFPRLARACAERRLSIFLLGAAPGVADEVARRMQEAVPGLRIAGVRDGFFAASEAGTVIEDINASGADVLLVAMGVPLQETWIAEHAAELSVPVRIGVGGLFDFYSGNIPRAPLAWRRAGLEWVWRLCQEPGRMWRRYLLGNPLFLWRVLRSRFETGGAEHALLRLYDDRRWRLEWRRQRVRVRRLLWLASTPGVDLAKRLLDVIVSAAALLVLAPLLAVVALAIRLDSPGPVLFAQQRIGRFGRPFRLLKFRSMYVDAEERRKLLEAQNEMTGGVTFKMKHDPRVTRVGRILRKLSIDELPQLWHVLAGDMSLVGPRPPLASETERYSLAHRRRLDVKPGLTCVWQVSGRSEIPFERQVELDVDYIHSWSLWSDLKLLLKTIPAVITGRGAY